jgi:hypothetical protein
MKVSIIAIIVIIGVLISYFLIGCNREIFDTTWRYDTAVIRWPDGSMKTIKIRSWRDYEGEQIQITDREGNVYLVSSFNTDLIRTNR